MIRIKLQPIKEWQEKEGTEVTGRIWIYVGKLHVGICTPIKNPTADIPKFRFSSMNYGLLEGMDSMGANNPTPPHKK